jgi:hypothetical protein
MISEGQVQSVGMFDRMSNHGSMLHSSKSRRVTDRGKLSKLRYGNTETVDKKYVLYDNAVIVLYTTMLDL